jgi:hypothetical protein
MAGFAMADLSATFNDFNGTANAISLTQSASAQPFSFDVFLSYTNTGGQPIPNVVANSLWLHGGANVSNFFTITGRNNTDTLSGNGLSYWDNPTQPVGSPVAITSTGADANDLGSTPSGPQTGLVAPQTNAFVTTLTLQVAANTPAGTYMISLGAAGTNAVPGAPSSVGDDAFDPSFPIPLSAANTYTITIAPVPEPATWSLMGFGALSSMGLTFLRARRRS